MKNLLIIFCFLFLAAGCSKQNISAVNAPPSSAPQYNYTHQLKIGGQTLMVEIAATPAQMQQGLSDRISMAENQGMLFDFGQQTADPAFWMKGMKFNLDFIWIAQNPSTGSGQVVGITPNVSHPNSPNDPLPYYYPPQPISQVLEVNAGWTEKNGIVVGDGTTLLK